MQKIQKVAVRGADGLEIELVLSRIVGKTAYVCSERKLAELAANPDADVEVGVPIKDMRYLNKEAAN